jgi:CheY-like chemotaxis protein
MSTTITTKRRVLFVDDEPAFLELLGEAMRTYSQGLWEIHLADNTSKALALLQEKPMHLVVVDIHMPVVDGIQFLKLLQRKYPNLPRAVLTGDASEEHRAACQNNGVELFLEKPRTPEGLEIVHATLDELAKWQPETGFQGVLRRVGLQDVLQMECLARSSVILEITARGQTGQIYIQQGSIIHARTDQLKGEEAFNHLLSFEGGQFNLKGFAEPAERTISGSWEFLLMEAARKRDEIMQSPGEAGGAEPTLARDPAPETPPVIPDNLFMPAPAPSPGDTELTAGPATDAPAIPESAPPEPTPPDAPRIEELLILGERGDVLHEWHCPQAQERLQLIEFVRQKARQVCQGLPVGPLERLEFEGFESRMVLRLEGSHVCLLRALREKPGVQVGAEQPLP